MEANPLDFVYDMETYPNVWTMGVQHAVSGQRWCFEISERRDDLGALIQFINYLRGIGARMIGFNSLAFDYPILHNIVEAAPFGHVDTAFIYARAHHMIHADKDEKFRSMVWDGDRYVEQIDLYKIHHFDNIARATSLKVLEFNMRAPNIADLPYPVGVELAANQIDGLIAYMFNDVLETTRFYFHTLEAIEFRETLSERYGRNFLNHNDTKIGKDYLIMRLEDAAPGSCYYKDHNRQRQPRQTRRDRIALAEVILPYVRFERAEFNRVKDWLASQVITETKGVFKDLSATIDGFTFDFGTGGIHGSIESATVEADEHNAIIDVDVTSFYPSLAIVNGLRPAHLGDVFNTEYAALKEQRAQHAKGTAINKALKLALNGTYGDSNNPYSPFYDPAFTMAITINGQLLLCMLAEQLMKIPGLQMIQANTDGLTVKIPRQYIPFMDGLCAWWEQTTGLELEYARYTRMFIRDVNSYIAEDEDGKLKRKGAYEYELEWHKNHSALVVPKAAEAALVHGVPVRDFIQGHADHMDFMLRTKVPRNSRLVLAQPDGTEIQVQNVTRYHAAKQGSSLVKIMPPLKGKDKERRIGICVGWQVAECNNIADYDPANLDLEYYIVEAEKLVKPLRRT